VGIVKRRLCASILVVPQRIMTLVRALLGRAAMTGVGAAWPVIGELAGEGREGESWAWLGGCRRGGGLGPGCSILSPYS
jgi:hypothetical protein